MENKYCLNLKKCIEFIKSNEDYLSENVVSEVYSVNENDTIEGSDMLISREVNEKKINYNESLTNIKYDLLMNLVNSLDTADSEKKEIAKNTLFEYNFMKKCRK